MVRRRRLGAELRRLREAAGLTCDEVAARLECSASKISRIETGRVSVSPRDVRDLADLYDLAEDQRDKLIELARESRQKGWWQAYGDSVQPSLATYIGMESAASEILHYNAIRIPPLLQTEDYARAVVTAGRAGAGRYPDPAGGVVEMLMEHQRLAAADPPKVWAVLDEAALRRHIGGQQIMREQIGHLLDLSSQPTTVIQIIPFTGGAYPALELSFVILRFADVVDTDVVAVGYATGVLWIEDTAEVTRYNVIYHHLQAAALSPDDSAALMSEILKDL